VLIAARDDVAARLDLIDSELEAAAANVDLMLSMADEPR
jgi:hypothetical protein